MLKSKIVKFLVLLIPFSLCAMEEEVEGPPDQLEICVGRPSYLVFKAMIAAQDAGYAYIKILSYEAHLGGDIASFLSSGDVPEGDRLEVVEEEGKVEFIGFQENTNNCACICIDDYRQLIEIFRDFESEDLD